MNPTLLDLALDHARHRPRATAVVDRQRRELTFAELWSHAAATGTALRERGAGPEDVIALALPQDARFVVGLLACWWAGSAPLLLDPAMPDARRDALVERARPLLTLDENALETAPQREAKPTPPPVATLADQLAYVIASSGSTGRPKLIEVTHRGLVPMLRDQVEAFCIDSASRVLWALSPGFDASLSDIGTALCAGACTVVMPNERLADAAALLPTLGALEVSHADLPPALVARLSPHDAPECLQTVIVGGEVTDAAAMRRWARRVRLVSVYGPTEATICTSVRVADQGWDQAWLGTPIGGARYRVEDGELWIAGPGLARGYDDAELTHDRFVWREGERWFRTGDRVEQRSDASGRADLVFCGRVDRQVKIRGRLVAPEEIEACLRREPGLRDVAVVPRDGHLVAFCELASPQPTVVDRLGTHCRDHLPAWMCPERWVVLPRLPRLGSGKVDTKALATAPIDAASGTAPATDRERALAAIWRDVLGASTIARESDFFALGGDSFGVVQLLAAAAREGIDLSADVVYRDRTLEAIARAATDDDRMPVDQLRAHVDVRLAEMPDAPDLSPAPLESPVLLTGASGFLGAHVLAELLDRGHEVTAIVRAQATDQALDRVRRSLLHLELDADLSRLRCHCGDLTDPDLDLAPFACTRSMVHAAARVSLGGAFSELAPANLEGTARLVRWARQRGIRSFDYASTLSVQVCTDDAACEIEENAPLREEGWVHGGYAQSKWAADRLVSEALPHARIHRFGLLMPRRGAPHLRPATHDWLTAVVRALATLGVAPESLRSAAMDATPVDHAADAMVAIASEGSSGAFSIAGTAITLETIVDAVRTGGRDIRWLHDQAWRATLRSPRTNSLAPWLRAALTLGLPIGDATRHQSRSAWLATGRRFDSARRDAILAPPEVDVALVRRYVGSMIEEIGP